MALSPPTVRVPRGRAVNYSTAEVPREVPIELRGYFPDGTASSTVMVVQFDGDKYHMMDSPGISKRREAMNIETGEIVILDFADVLRGQQLEKTD